LLDVADPHNCVHCPLQECDGLRPLEDTQARYINSIKKGEMLVSRGDSLLTEEENGTHLFTILEGVFIRFRSLEDGRRQIVNFMFPGDLIGLQAAFDNPANHSVEALTSARVCRFDRADFVRLIQESPRLGYDVTWLAAKEETALENHIVSLGQRSARERVIFLAIWLIDRAQATGVAADDNRLPLSLTQSQVADMLGLSLVHTNRTMRALQLDGLVQWGQKEICIPDMDKAAELVGFSQSKEGQRPYI
tara:strand:- start:6669 stop:7415 length:747 start_codon:yes stop_codon:yes gene_type:complete